MTELQGRILGHPPVSQLMSDSSQFPQEQLDFSSSFILKSALPEITPDINELKAQCFATPSITDIVRYSMYMQTCNKPEPM